MQRGHHACVHACRRLRGLHDATAMMCNDEGYARVIACINHAEIRAWKQGRHSACRWAASLPSMQTGERNQRKAV